MLTLLTLLAFLLTGPAVSVTASPTHGPAPFRTLLTLTATGPYSGDVCIVITEDTAVVGQMCADGSVDLKAGETGTLDLPIGTSVPGEYVIHPVLPGDDKVTFGEPIKITVEPGQ